MSIEFHAELLPPLCHYVPCPAVPRLAWFCFMIMWHLGIRTIELEVEEKNDPRLNKHLKEQIMQLNDLIKESINKP